MRLLSLALLLAACAPDDATPKDSGAPDEVDADTDTDSDADGDTDTDSDTDTDTDTDSDTDTDIPLWSPPPDRVVPWEGKVGVAGGIPTRSVVVDCVTEYGAHADGTDTSRPIQQCLDGISDEEVAWLPAGTYSLSTSVEIPSHRTLRGDGATLTILEFTGRSSYDVLIGSGYTDASRGGVAILAGADKDSDRLTLASTRGIVAGDHVYVTELNDTTIPVDPVGTGGLCNWCGLYGAEGDRARLQLTEVVAVEGDDLLIDPPMYFTFSSALAPEVNVAPDYTVYAGLEALTVRNQAGVAGGHTNVRFQGAAHSWVKDTTLETCGDRCVDLYFDGFRNEIRDNTLIECLDHESSDSCYGVQIQASSGTLVENNVFDHTSDGVILVSASGNVVGYNYVYGVHRTQDQSDWFWPSEWTHGAHSSYNLWEGNELNAIEWDDYWGSNSHDTEYRNRIHGMDETVAYDLRNLMQVGAILTYIDNHAMMAVGNVLGTAGFHDTYETRNEEYWTTRPIWATGAGGVDDEAFTTFLRHQNYDTFTDSVHACSETGEPGCQGGGDEPAIPASLYLPDRPAFFAACEQWPPFGPEVPGYETGERLPAARRQKGLPEPACR